MSRLGLFIGFAVSGLLAGCAGSSGDEQASGESALDQSKLPACLSTLACAAPKLSFQTRGWRHGIASRVVSKQGAPRHRGRDLFLNPGESQHIIGKFTYGLGDKDLEDEEIDVFVQRDCGSDWEKLGTAVTTDGDHKHPTVEGIADDGGRIFFEVPTGKALGPGRHRVRLVVAGDGSSTDLFIDVVPQKTPIFVSDVDGTLTTSENAEFVKVITGGQTDTHPDAPEALRALAAKGYRPLYLTARPEWLMQRTRVFLESHGFPPGVIYTSSTLTGAGFGASASTFKADVLAMLAQRGLVPSYGFGNRESDITAYSMIQPDDHRILYQLDGNIAGRRIDSYTELLPSFGALDPACK